MLAAVRCRLHPHDEARDGYDGVRGAAHDAKNPFPASRKGRRKVMHTVDRVGAAPGAGRDDEGKQHPARVATMRASRAASSHATAAAMSTTPDATNAPATSALQPKYPFPDVVYGARKGAAPIAGALHRLGNRGRE
eukprot:gene21247-19632_t